MKNQIIFLGFMLYFPCLLWTQNAYNWEPQPYSALKMSSFPADTSAPAVIIADIGIIRVNVSSGEIDCFFHRKTRVKILKTSGFDYGDVSIPIYTKDDQEVLSDLVATIYNPNGSSRTIGKKEVFWEKVNDKITRVKFAFPEIQVGSVIECQYDIKQKSIFILPEWRFQHDIPTLWSEVTLQVPSVLEYVSLINGDPPKQSDEISERINIAGFSNVPVISVRYQHQDLPALRAEGYITTMEDYYARIRFQLSVSVLKGYRQEIFSSWEKTASELAAHELFGKSYTRKAALDDILAQLTPHLADLSTPEERLRKVHQFVSHHMTWTGSNQFLAEDALEKCFIRKKGSSAEINLLLCGLLQALDFEAKPMLLSTRRHGQVFTQYPIVDQFNYVVVHVNLAGKSMLLDATQPYLAPGVLPENTLNRTGWIVDGKNSHWDNIPAGKSSAAHSFSLSLDEQGNLSGKMSISQEGYDAAQSRQKIALSKKGNNWEYKTVLPLAELAQYDSVSMRNFDDLSKPLILSGKVNIPEALMINGDLAYLNPILVPFYRENPFRTTERAYPVDIPYPLSYRQVFMSKLPPGFSVEEMPAGVNLTLPNNGGRFSYQAQILSDKIQVTTQLQINQLRYNPEEYPALKKFLDLVIEKQQAQIVLRKKG